MNYVENAIRDAVEKGGYQEGKQPDISTNNDGIWMSFWAAPFTQTYHQSDIFLDPTFWQTLGKVRGWMSTLRKDEQVWLDNWHNFIDHLADGKDAESFFASLITQSTQ